MSNRNATETLNIGSLAPDFCLTAANRNGDHSLVSLVEHSTVVLEIVRGTWCHNCRKRMLELEFYISEFKAASVTLVSVAAEKRDGIWDPVGYFSRNPVSFPFLLDEDRAVIKLYGLYHRIGWDALSVAHPATMVIDRSRRIRYIYRGKGKADGAPLSDVLSISRALESGEKPL